MHLALELIAAEDGRVEGSVSSNAGREQATFSGWLELLRLLETAVGHPGDHTREGGRDLGLEGTLGPPTAPDPRVND